MTAIEAGIRPLVDALNATGLVTTFSSCEGHFDAVAHPPLIDRPHAYVRFVPATGVRANEVEKLMAYLLTRFRARHGLIPVKLTGYKQYTPSDDEMVEETFVLELNPVNRFDPPARHRADTDRAIEQAVALCRAIE